MIINHSALLHITHYDHSNTDTITLAELVQQSEYTILYFYPKDCTSGCTLEAIEFNQLKNEFSELWAQIIGVSKDNITSHNKFINQNQLTIDLISDTDTSLHQAFGTRVEKNMYWRIYMGTVRTTFVLDKSARIITQYNKVTARGHAKQVLKDLIEHIKWL